MLKKVLAVTTLAGALAGGTVLAAAPASAAGQLCYNYNVELPGQAPITSGGTQCTDLPV